MLQVKAWRKQAEALQKEVTGCKQQLQEKLSGRDELKASLKHDAEEHVRLNMREQEIEYERKIQVSWLFLKVELSSLRHQMGCKCPLLMKGVSHIL